VEISQQTVDQSMREWNEKWFSKDGIKEEILPKIQNSLPEFLQYYSSKNISHINELFLINYSGVQ
jgi:hypothetical protein